MKNGYQLSRHSVHQVSFALDNPKILLPSKLLVSPEPQPVINGNYRLAARPEVEFFSVYSCLDRSQISAHAV